ncbi:tyrosine-type recombinase/integrase [Chryseosolibacter indicus]|uniref:Tyrosine recombinase XerC n=1 Tax=Chryseosolibacter indicus TaxID=2782351 RepID=A0ABS5VVI1_9BACT|nr:tyrosine-type recombinase/integrase [Chryseosolibacter indicus]MBT1705448.1 tyrosine-type recombinase/integrase [Chryseosolibacter indicus]
MIESFIKHLRFEKRASSNTVLAYQNDLNQFATFLSTTFSLSEPENAEHPLIRAWLISLTESGLEPPSVNRKIACLRTFYKYLRRQEVIGKDPMMKIRVLKTKKRLPVFIKENDMVKVLDQISFDTSFNGCRDRMILELLYGTGIRLSELIGLEDSKIDLRNQTIRVLGKRNKERVVPVSSSLISIIEEYKSARNREVEKKEHGQFLVTSSGDTCSARLVQNIVKKYLAITNSEKKSPHVLRHTYATHLLNRGAEINAVKDLLGHTSLAATQVYTHNTMEKLKQAFDKAHPKA